MPSKRPPRPPMVEPKISTPATELRAEAARPKFNRRPHFDLPLDDTPAIEPTPIEVNPHRIAWYEDLRFGAVLMILLLLLNLALIYAIPMMAAPANDAAHETTPSTLDTGGTMPSPQSSITVYAHPDARTDATDKPAASSSNGPNYHTSDIPPPTASPLDGNKSMEENIHGDEQ